MKRILFSLFLLVTLSSTVTYADNTLKVGTPKGDFSVLPLGGALYSIAIECPPGINGMEPRLSLTYTMDSIGEGLTEHSINISSLQNGVYSVSLIENGLLIDSKTILIQ